MKDYLFFLKIVACAACENGLVNSEIGLWDVKTGECRALLKHHEHNIVAMAYSRDDRYAEVVAA